VIGLVFICYPPCTPHMHPTALTTHLPRTQHAPNMRPTCTPHMPPTCPQHAPNMHPTCPQHAPNMHPPPSMAVLSHAERFLPVLHFVAILTAVNACLSGAEADFWPHPRQSKSQRVMSLCWAVIGCVFVCLVMECCVCLCSCVACCLLLVCLLLVCLVLCPCTQHAPPQHDRCRMLSDFSQFSILWPFSRP